MRRIAHLMNLVKNICPASKNRADVFKTITYSLLDWRSA